jgi:hypothetical protein
VLRHNDKSVQMISPIVAITVQSFEKKAYVRFDDEESAAPPGQESDEISSGRGDHSHWLQKRTSAAGSRHAIKPNAARVKLVPFPKIFPKEFPSWESLQGPFPAGFERGIHNSDKRRLSRTKALKPSSQSPKPAPQNSTCARNDPTTTGPRSRLYPGFTMYCAPGAT